jgi:hypothetical protein
MIHLTIRPFDSYLCPHTIASFVLGGIFLGLVVNLCEKVPCYCSTGIFGGTYCYPESTWLALLQGKQSVGFKQYAQGRIVHNGASTGATELREVIKPICFLLPT